MNQSVDVVCYASDLEVLSVICCKELCEFSVKLPDVMALTPKFPTPPKLNDPLPETLQFSVLDEEFATLRTSLSIVVLSVDVISSA